MFGGFGRRKERDVGELKRQQLEALKQQVPQVRAVNAVSRRALPVALYECGYVKGRYAPVVRATSP